MDMSRLGLVCITTSDDVRYRTITRKRLLQHEPEAQQQLLAELYQANLQRLAQALAYCRQEGITLYRMPSSLFPFSDEPVGRDVLERMADDVAAVGRQALAHDIRLVMHPDQFVVLSSDSSGVVANSIKILDMHANIMDLLQQPRSPWAVLEIHGGKGGRSREMMERIGDLPDGIRLRLALENDEYAYGAEDILEICHATGVPMVFDAHHHVIKESLSSYEHPSVGEMLRRARDTWPDPGMQLVHISNGRSAFNDRHHSDFIDAMPSSYAEAPWIEIEAKLKEQAIRRLRQR
ncbi:UV-damage endonuclease [Noviherbaspirillum humi]|uniref:UV-damage endonuclease n=1 Tax=Noviherbaspirillum humi TaxID=1688639 RepID=A0A239L731_9BURK|nr:UV DNA damage repair endonuclease UvsE [Noviherbaspirillum humi]SNT25718.1 UV-damage endonuclease [Noviherbaspirillum humi]